MRPALFEMKDLSPVDPGIGMRMTPPFRNGHRKECRMTLKKALYKGVVTPTLAELWRIPKSVAVMPAGSSKLDLLKEAAQQRIFRNILHVLTSVFFLLVGGLSQMRLSGGMAVITVFVCLAAFVLFMCAFLSAEHYRNRFFRADQRFIKDAQALGKELDCFDSLPQNPNKEDLWDAAHHALVAIASKMVDREIIRYDKSISTQNLLRALLRREELGKEFERLHDLFGRFSLVNPSRRIYFSEAAERRERNIPEEVMYAGS